MVGDDELEETCESAIAPVVPVVRVSRNKARKDDDYDDDYENDSDYKSEHDDEDHTDNGRVSRGYNDDDYDEEEAVSPRQPQPASRSHGHHQPRYKSTNGKRKVDMTPPDEKLKRSESLAKQFGEEGKNDKAITEYTKCLAFTRIIHGSSHWKHALSVVNLAEAYFNLKGYHAQAEYHADNAKSIMLSGGHTAGSQEEKSDVYLVLIKIYRVLGQALTGLKKYNEADQSLIKADKISQERSKLGCVTDSECDYLDISLFLAMARLYGRQKKHALACAKYDKVLELMEHQYGTDDARVMKVYTEYGMLEQSKGRHANHEKSIHLMLQAYSIASSIHREGHPELVDTALNLSQAYANTGREDSEGLAKGYLEECLNTCVLIHGPNHKKTLEVEDHLAKLLIRTDNLMEAMTMLKSSLPKKSETFGDYSEPVSDTYKLMGSVSLAEGELEKALRFYKKCHQIEQVLLGKSHKKTKDTQRTMELIMANPSISKKFVLDKADELQKRPRFNSIVGRTK